MKQRKIRLWQGSQCRSESPLILHHRKWPSRTTHEKGLKNYRKGGTVVHGKRVFQGSEAPRIASSPHTPDQHILLHVSLTPLVTCPKVGTFGCLDHRGKRYSIPDSGSHLRRLVNCRSQRPSSHGTTSPPVQSQTKMTPDQRPHPQSSRGPCVALGTVCVQGLVWNLPLNHTREVSSPPC